MIHLDANYLIRAGSPPSAAERSVQGWLERGEQLAASSIAWAEFLNGPVELDQVRRMEVIVGGRILSFGRNEAEVASRLFNRTGRRRGSQADCFIAATAICGRAALATENKRDFQLFVAQGLQLA
jgi:predicted nucleic acid-binding protein